MFFVVSPEDFIEPEQCSVAHLCCHGLRESLGVAHYDSFSTPKLLHEGLSSTVCVARIVIQPMAGAGFQGRGWVSGLVVAPSRGINSRQGLLAAELQFVQGAVLGAFTQQLRMRPLMRQLPCLQQEYFIGTARWSKIYGRL